MVDIVMFLPEVNCKVVAFATNLVLQVTERLASVNLAAALGSVITVLTGCPVVNLENLLGCNCHNKLLLVPILYSSIIPRSPTICTIRVTYFT